MKDIKNYQPFEGFYDLREFNLPKNIFIKLWKIQEHLYKQNKRGKYLKEFYPLEWQKLKELSAQYQGILFQYQRRRGNYEL